MSQETSHKRIRMSIKTRLSLILLILMVLMAAVIINITINALSDNYLSFEADRAMNTVDLISRTVSWEQLQHYAETGEEDENSARIRKFMNDTKESNNDLSYIYIFVPDETQFMYVIDAIASDDDPAYISAYGDIFEYTDTEYNEMLPDFKASRSSQDLMLGENDEFGSYLYAWAPILDKDGKAHAMVEADVTVDWLAAKISQIVEGVIVTLVVSILVTVLIILWFLNFIVGKPLAILKKGVESYREGAMDLDTSRFKRNDEIREIAVSFDELMDKVRNYTEEVKRASAEQERIGAELSVATQIQGDMLPCIFPAFPDLEQIDLFASMSPIKEVGGDFYDFFRIDRNHIGLVTADVEGKGIPAALFMVISRTLIKNEALAGISPAQVLEAVSGQLNSSSNISMIVAVWFGIYELSTRRLMYVNAGQQQPALYRASTGKYELLRDIMEPEAGKEEHMHYTDCELALERGDRLFLYTDGIPETVGARSEEYGTLRILRCLNSDTECDPQETIELVQRDLERFRGKAEQQDDITMMSFYVN